MALQLSLVCPIYKVKEYIPDLIDSLIRGANSPQVQVIFVNDATPDESMLVCKNLLLERANEVRFAYKLVDCETNGGVAAARNRGLQEVESPYVGFLDSDDALDAHYYAVLGPMLATGQWDLIEFGYREFSGAVPAPAGDVGRVVGSNTADPFRFGFFSWLRVYRAATVAGLQFPVGKLYEDLGYVCEAFSLTTQRVRLTNRLIFYRRRPGSITAKRDHRYADQLVNLVAGMTAWTARRPEERELIRLGARKAMIILLKGTRISDAEERTQFFAACMGPLNAIKRLLAGQGMHGATGWAWLVACRSWIGLQRMSGRA